MEVAERDKMFDLIAGMSDRQVDPQAKTRLKALMGRPNEEIKWELLGLIDDIAFYAWTSGFEIRVLHTIWLNVGGTEEELKNRDVSMTEENKAKYKWQR